MAGSFSLIVATPVFLIPYERMKVAHPLNQRAPEGGLYYAIRRVERQRFLEAEFWDNAPDGVWRFSRVVNDVNWTQGWRDEVDLHPMDGEADNTIERRSVNDVLRVVRNALAPQMSFTSMKSDLRQGEHRSSTWRCCQGTRKPRNNVKARRPIGSS